MDKIQKALNRLSDKEKKIVKEILERLQRDEVMGMDLQKLKGTKDILRVRKGDLRLIYRKVKNNIIILAIERRSEKTYRDY
jgi:mRNA-degrading endonuclease RelE of RelBE toxin-antitoxin system